MNELSQFFVRNIIPVYFLYGLAFFAMGLALALAKRRTSTFRFALAIVPLAWFGLLHGAHEWFEMFQKVASLSRGYTPGIGAEVFRIAVLVASFMMLAAFGMMLLSEASTTKIVLVTLAALTAIWLLGLLAVWRILQPEPQELVAIADVLARYTLGIPGALLGTWALMQQQRTFREHDMPQFGRDLVWAATALFLYGIIGQIFVRPTVLIPSNVLNSTAFLQWFGIPVQVFRGVMAAALAYFMVRALNAFELESQRNLDNAVQLQFETERKGRQETERLYAEVQNREEQLARLLHQVVGAQETERQRIARELHDTTGQSLTAIGLGLKGLEGVLQKEKSMALTPAAELRLYASRALAELRDIIADLRPSQLDDLGLVPTLRWYTRVFSERWGIACDFNVQGEPKRLPSDFEIVLFRISQEALTNIARHAQATRARVLVSFNPGETMLQVEDNGQGFVPEEALQSIGSTSGWGILGMHERAALVGGRVEIVSKPGQGACLRVVVPLIMEAQNGGKDASVSGG
ncbi:MAG: sensor histidine kinase [Caldilineales bacterium]|nr:sensor histidine kinase [Caldilineales bacterium]